MIFLVGKMLDKSKIYIFIRNSIKSIHFCSLIASKKNPARNSVAFSNVKPWHRYETFDAFFIFAELEIVEDKSEIAQQKSETSEDKSEIAKQNAKIREAREHAKKISKKLRTPFIFIVTENEKKDGNQSENALLDRKKKDFFENVKDLVDDQSDIYTSEDIDTKKNDFKKRCNNIISKLVKRRKDAFLHSLNEAAYVTNEKTNKLYKEAQYHGVSHISDFYDQIFFPWKNVPINFAITGDAGTGKSSFINAVRR